MSQPTKALHQVGAQAQLTNAEPLQLSQMNALAIWDSYHNFVHSRRMWNVLRTGRFDCCNCQRLIRAIELIQNLCSDQSLIHQTIQLLYPPSICKW